MNNIKDAKKIYDEIEIPKELNQTVTNLINNYEMKVTDTPMNNKRKNTRLSMLHTMVAAAAVVLCFTIALNTNETFAEAAGNLPVIGGVARVLTIRSYQTSEDNMNISVNVPEITVDSSKNAGQVSSGSDINLNTEKDSVNSDKEQLLTEINAEIDKIINDYQEDAKSRMKADKEAFIATGGTEEEWAKRELNVNVDYQVTYQERNLLSLIISTDESWYGAYDIKHYYNIDLKQNKEFTLKDILGDNYSEIANDSIINQMKKRAAEDSNIVYWGIVDDGESNIKGFTTVDENTKFYLNEQGKPVVCFDKYEIAPGFMGAQEFIIE